MELNFFKIENSFNKTGSSSTELKDLSSTKGQGVQNPIIINSQTISSITASQIQNDNFVNIKLPKKSLIREIFIGVICIVLSAIITYFILGIK